MGEKVAGEQLLVVFIHGFKGTDETFGAFPERLQHLLAQTTEGIDVECIVFPAYETKGDLDAAVERFADWLAQLTVEKEVAKGLGGGAGKSKVVLCGHRRVTFHMGGLLAADTLLALYESRPDKEAPLWPNIIACIAFDTPYFGVHPSVFKNSASKVVKHISTARTVVSDVADAFSYFTGKKGAESAAASMASSSTTIQTPLLTGPEASISAGWQKWALPAAYAISGIAVAGAAAGTAYWRREDLGLGYGWVQDHLRYVGALWDEKRLLRRVEKVMDIEKDIGVLFRTYYTLLPAALPGHVNPRTFIYLPKSYESSDNFRPATNSVAQEEIEAHTGMFGASTNDGYYGLGLDTARVIRDALERARHGSAMDSNSTSEKVEADNFDEVQESTLTTVEEFMPTNEGKRSESTAAEEIEDTPWR
ncbi:hypothetical protein GLOTRDRAFT_70221 [Gloeophyllum trabeum ATCC 11539]|uniref:DUF676 domain-containing protein n=1 Tax=Gloeophyllum trabeum (strain ATCC 11539 / FP-39264 / Madison 617) TaxID=670483 RepID=S7RW46_GLOTA|nr:uncharacterized protein GLOTRDRAFT_70221 [Gloeophyllum trabeum ATCC 11539]EPQ59080.1 hypothetical protein GLOTRDRAFT_70221 [Gloeophyllum trabeum ATCC 11539]